MTRTYIDVFCSNHHPHNHLLQSTVATVRNQRRAPSSVFARRRLLIAMAAALVSGAPLAAQAADSRIGAHTLALHTPRLQGIDNFRDIAGTTTAYATAHDGIMRSGVFYRSNAVTPSAADLKVLNSLGIKAVYDLRTPGEIATTPDAALSGAINRNIDIIGSGTSGANIMTVSMKTAADAVAVMENTNRQFVYDAGMRKQFGLLFNQLAAVDGAALFHCTAGKDRTGWTAAVLQTIAGVDSATIMRNYLATNDYTAARVAATLKAMPAAQAVVYAPLLGVQASFLQAGLDQLKAQYGSMDNYLKQGLGLSQETIYVLRAKMVYYNSLPGQPALLGNAAAGARLLQQLQDSKLSGHYSAYNYYLQSAIDAGNLGGVESRAGAQVHADAASYLLRQNATIEQAAAPFASGTDLQSGRYRLWTTALAGYLSADGSSDVAGSSEHSQGLMIGVTRRISDQFSAHAGVGYTRASIGAANATATTRLGFVTGGMRFAFDSLERGVFVDASGSGGHVDYRSKRQLGAGLGSASGDSDGRLSGATLALGNRLPLKGVVLEPSIGVGIHHLDLSRFKEAGSELALDVDNNRQTHRSAMARLNASFSPVAIDRWQLVPGMQLGYEHALGDHPVTSQGHLLGLTIEQRAAFDQRDQFTGGANVMATRGALSLRADLNAVANGSSHGINSSLKASYAF